jgi:dihydrofolate reductase
MAKVVVEISASLDGFIAGPNQTLEEPLGAGGEKLHEWGVRLKTFRELHGMEGGDTDSDDELFAPSVEATGPIVMGRRMFSGASAGLLDELRLHLVPLLLGDGVRLFENVSPQDLERTSAIASPTGVTHLALRVRQQ